MSSTLVIDSPLRSSLSFQPKFEENPWQKSSRSYLEMDALSPSDKKAKQLSAEAKAKITNRVSSTDEQRQHNSTEDFYSAIPDAEKFGPVTEPQIQSIILKIHDGIDELNNWLNNCINKDDQPAKPSSEPLTDFNEKSFQYLIYKIQAFFLAAFQEGTKDFAKANQALREGFKAQIKATQEKEQERLAQIKERQAQAYKSGQVSVAVDAASAIFAVGCGIATGGIGLIAIGAYGTGASLAIKAWFEQDVLDQRAAGNEKQAEESERMVQLATVMEAAGLLLTFGAVVTRLAVEAAAVELKAVQSIDTGFSALANSEAAITPLELEIELNSIAQQALQAEGLTVELKAIEKLNPSLWKIYCEAYEKGVDPVYKGLKPLISEAISKKWTVAQYMRSFPLALQSFSTASNGILQFEMSLYDGHIKKLVQEASALRFWQAIMQQVIKENTENLELNARKVIKLLKAVQLLLTRQYETLDAAARAIPVAV